MARCKTFRYPSRARIRALEIYHRSGGDCSTREIVETLKNEGFGNVAANAVQRWLRDDIGNRAVEVAELAQRLRRKTAAADDGRDSIERIQASGRQIADLLAVTAERATKELPSINLETVDDFARVSSCVCSLVTSAIEAFRLVEELKVLSQREGSPVSSDTTDAVLSNFAETTSTERRCATIEKMDI